MPILTSESLTSIPMFILRITASTNRARRNAAIISLGSPKSA
ncbi:MAG: hypothetical protein BWY85_00765 [Firmicutes bacterium ADurb.Bin506]|nr:MAG: hypothetical protein BWY85_00765 [Firmicutes bacterium ADurb.Bin506]